MHRYTHTYIYTRLTHPLVHRWPRFTTTSAPPSTGATSARRCRAAETSARARWSSWTPSVTRLHCPRCVGVYIYLFIYVYMYIYIYIVLMYVYM